MVSSKSDLKFMRLALDQARKAVKSDEVPVGAVLVARGHVFAADRNRIREKKDPTAHAEILVLQKAARRLKNERLGGTILFTTVEPCAMCAGAAVLARVAEVVYGAADPKAGAGGSLMNLLSHPELNHRARVRGNVLAPEARRLLQGFFRKKRTEKRK